MAIGRMATGLLAALALLAGCRRGPAPPPPPAGPDAAQLLAAPGDGRQWIMAAGDYGARRFSPLAQVDAANVERLRPVLQQRFPGQAGRPATPLAIDDTLFLLLGASTLLAVDAADGTLRWRFDAASCCTHDRHGLAALGGRLYFVSADEGLVAVDAATGATDWTTALPAAAAAGATPLVAGPRVFVGTREGMVAVDAASGRLLWRGQWGPGGGAAAAGARAVYDPQEDLVLFGTAAADARHAASLVALRAADGQYVWHYRATPATLAAYDATAPMLVAGLAVDGVQRRVLLQPDANGFFYALDVATGELLGAEAYTDVSWADGIDLPSGRPLAPGPRAGGGMRPPPGPGDGPPAAFHPASALVYFVAPDSTRLQAWDPLRGVIAWQGTGDAPAGTAEAVAATGAGGVLASAGGLVFHGIDGALHAHDARDGRLRWRADLPPGPVSGVATYQRDGRQQLAVAVGTADGPYLAVYALP